MKNLLQILAFSATFLIGTSFQSSASMDCEEPFVVHQSYYKIEFGSSISIEVNNQTKEQATWQIFREGDVIRNGFGNTTENIKFDIPGNYIVLFTLPGNANHATHTAQSIVEVLPTRLEFFIQNASFSREIVMGLESTGTFLKVPVKLHTYHNQPYSYGPFHIQSSGYSEIELNCAKKIELVNGDFDLVFELGGIPKQAGPAQFAFFNTAEEGFFLNFIIK